MVKGLFLEKTILTHFSRGAEKGPCSLGNDFSVAGNAIARERFLGMCFRPALHNLQHS